MRYFFQNRNTSDLIVFFAGWGCDENQFTNLHDNKDVLILYDYQDLSLDFDFSKYKNIDLIAYSAGVFIASLVAEKIPHLCRTLALCGNPYLFDETLGINAETLQIFKEISLDNYLDFRKKYMVINEDEYQKYNALQSMRTIESSENELKALQNMYFEKKSQLHFQFDRALMAENDLIFNVQAQKDFYKEKLYIIKNAKHHIFFRFKSFEDILNMKNF